MDINDINNAPIIPERRCPCCGAYEPEYFYLDDDEEVVGCTECVYKTDVIY